MSMQPKSFSFLTAITLAVSLALPSFAQTQIPAPTGWKTQTKANGATTFTPSDLRAGEVYNVTIYDAKPLGGKSLEAYLRGFAGPVGQGATQLKAPLTIEVIQGRVATGAGAYNGPDGTGLVVVFYAVSLDEGATVHVERTLSSVKGEVFTRYQTPTGTIIEAMGERARNEASGLSQAPDNAPAIAVPAGVPAGTKLGGDIVPGVYVGEQVKYGIYGIRSTLSLRVYIYASGEYRICNDKDEDISEYSTGRIKYNRARGRLDIKQYYALGNDPAHDQDDFCVYGRNAEDKPVIYGLSSAGITTSKGYIALYWHGPPTGRKSKGEEEAPARALEAKKQAAQDKLNRIQTRVAPGRGVPASQIAALVHHFDSQLRQTVTGLGGTSIIPSPDGSVIISHNSPVYGMAHDVTNDTYLLLRDGTIHRGLEVAPDQFDAAASRRKEPQNWGLWKSENGKPQMSFAGKPYEPLPGKRVSPNPAQSRLSGRYELENGGITFTPAGRFQRSPLKAKSDPSAKYTLSQGQNPVAGGDLSGTYEISGYALTLRYQGGKVERMLFFPEDASRKSLWFEGGWIGLDKPKSTLRTQTP